MPDKKENSAAIQDLRQELIVEVSPSELLVPDLHQYLLLEMFEFSHKGSWTLVVRLLSTHVVYPVECDALYGVNW